MQKFNLMIHLKIEPEGQAIIIVKWVVLGVKIHLYAKDAKILSPDFTMNNRRLWALVHF
jgi:hypothetical protein